jgi:hypothetical protein
LSCLCCCLDDSAIVLFDHLAALSDMPCNSSVGGEVSSNRLELTA